jgi:hypothetical protein
MLLMSIPESHAIRLGAIATAIPVTTDATIILVTLSFSLPSS